MQPSLSRPIKIGVVVALAGVALYAWKGRERPATPAVAPGKSDAPPLAITVVHRYEPAAAAGVAAGQIPASPTEPTEPPPAETALDRLQRSFDVLPTDPTTEQRNDALLHSLLTRLGHGQLPPIESFRCRGSSCQMRVSFQNGDQARGTLNLLPEQEEWKQANLGFNAVCEDPSDPDCLRFSVFFTSPPSSS